MSTADSIQPLAADIVALCKTAAYDDMAWSEIDRALQLASHDIKLIFAQHGTLDPSPADNLPPPEADAEAAPRKRKRSIFT